MASGSYSEIPRAELETFLDDLVNAQHGLWMLLVACGERQRTTLRSAVHDFDKLADTMLTKPPPAPEGVAAGVDGVWNAVLAAQNEDLGP